MSFRWQPTSEVPSPELPAVPCQVSSAPGHQSEPSAHAELTVTITVRADAAEAASVTGRLVRAVRRAVDLAGASLTVDGVTIPRQHPVSRGDAPGGDLGPRAAGPVHIVVPARRVTRAGVDVPLTRMEFDLLLFLCENPGVVHQRSDLVARVWGAPGRSSERTIDVYVRRIRGKLGVDCPLITTVRGVGYRVDDPALVVLHHAVRSGSARS
ncbi:winged helix-turn-helix domain-containing protein [Actinoalloteichus spitiensis]|uniref:winged helix-turn-helix domain-containing protein n=1 Tax=Actinoalloteichus spitiensis TaxID=252394 RepID=UPI000379F7A6|nr:winged helix-turn-helix domain-containing protein [Actinoalloteichus spitiensis]